jgi:hypothetical protein
MHNTQTGGTDPQSAGCRWAVQCWKSVCAKFMPWPAFGEWHPGPPAADS